MTNTMRRIGTGPIPARAGEPVQRGLALSGLRAYPRPRGGAAATDDIWLDLGGLSPPARGSLNPCPHHERLRRPIPARAGEPSYGAASYGAAGAYPRPRGGAVEKLVTASSCTGLSPPARGSPSRGVRQRDKRGPIPARAGEPTEIGAVTGAIRAYPRPRGGADYVRPTIDPSRGLSPPARGSLEGPLHAGDLAGPIPARAGEPIRGVGLEPRLRAYPRPRGGASARRTRLLTSTGLSPPARGSP